MTDTAKTMRVDEKKLAEGYAAGDFKVIIQEIVRYLIDLNEFKVRAIDGKLRSEIDFSVESISYYLTRPEFNVPRDAFLSLLRMHPQLTHLIGLSSYDTSDGLIGTTLRKANPSIPVMLFHTCRNHTEPPRGRFFDLDQTIASLWYGYYFYGTRSFTNPRILKNLREHLAYWHDKMQLVPSLANGYMRCTYIDTENDRHWRVRFNELVKKAFQGTKLSGTPDKRKIALVTGRWSPINPTYKNRYPLIKALSERFDLTLVHCGEERKDLETSLFSEVKTVAFKNGQLDIDAIRNNNFGLVYYPDVGMNVESRFISNLRVAPVQVMSNSHPVSTFGSEVDYFLTGKESESQQSPQRFYSERLVLVPGIGTMPDVKGFRPTLDPIFEVDPNAIACPWGSLKINTDLVERLKKIDKKVGGKAFFNFFVSIDPSSGAVPLMRKEIEEILGPDKFSLYANARYEDYMAKLRTCNFALDAFPFGGNTSIIDCMFSSVPIVSQRGWQFYNMAGPVILERFGLGELVVRNEGEYIESAVKLFQSPKTVRKIREKMASMDLDQGLNSLTSVDKFVEAFEYMMEHPKGNLKVTKPLEFV